MLLDDKLFNRISADAKASPKLLMSFNLHESQFNNEKRVFLGLEPGTIVPHQKNSENAVTILIVRGMAKVAIYDDDMNIIEECVLNPLDGKYGYQISRGVWYGIEGFAPNTVLFEVI